MNLMLDLGPEPKMYHFVYAHIPKFEGNCTTDMIQISPAFLPGFCFIPGS
jgi:hypothetical protein